MTVSFVLANTQHGGMIVNRLDYNKSFGEHYYGVGFQLLNHGVYDGEEVKTLKEVLTLRGQQYGRSVVAMDCGANIGVHTVEFARHLQGWGEVVAIEAQERLFYALAGNIALNNCWNARAIWAAVGAREGFLDIPEPDYTRPSSFGSLELVERVGNEFIGQAIDYDKPRSRVRTVTIDNSGLDRLDLLKLDVEGMELEALAGAMRTIETCKPVVFVETIKIPKQEFKDLMDRLDYTTYAFGMSALCVHKEDKIAGSIEAKDIGEEAAA